MTSFRIMIMKMIMTTMTILMTVSGMMVRVAGRW